MEFRVVLNQVIIIFIILVFGYVAGKKGVIDSIASKKLSELLLFVTSPMMVLQSFFVDFTQERLINILWVLGVSTLTFIVSIFLSKLIYGKFNDSVKVLLRFSAIFTNCGYIGLPLMKAIFGEEGVFYGSFYIVTYHAFFWSYGYVMFGKKDKGINVIKRTLKTPSIIAFIVGIIVFLLRIDMPDTIKGAIGAVGDMTMPLSMLIIGGVMSRSKLINVFNDWRIYLASVVRLIFMPILAIFLLGILGVPDLPLAIVVTALAMPVGANMTIFAEMFDKDSLFASNCVTVSTLLSIITIPIIVGLI